MCSIGEMACSAGSPGPETPMNRSQHRCVWLSAEAILNGSTSASVAIHICVVEIGLHAGPTDARGFFGSAAALPVRFEIDRIGVANLRECAKLGGPIDVALVDGRPLRLTSAVLGGVLDVAVVDAVFGQSVPAAGIGVEFAAHDGIARVPVKRKIARGDAGEGGGGFSSRRGVAGEF